jgi:hypothetical protein
VVGGRKVEIGQRYRIVRAGFVVQSTEWEVVKVFMPWPGSLEHARLKSVIDHAETMTLATSVITDKTRFVRSE